MESKSGRVIASFPLTRVVSEIAEKLIANDWMRCATADDTSYYFIVGVEAHGLDDSGDQDHMSLGVPGATNISPFGQSQVDAQVAATRASGYYLRHAIAKLVGSGVDQERLRQFASGNFDDLTFMRGHVGAPGTDSFQAFSELLEAMLLAKGLDLEMSEAERRAQVDVAVQKIYLRELAQLYKRGR